MADEHPRHQPGRRHRPSRLRLGRARAEAEELARNVVRERQFGADERLFVHREDGNCLVPVPNQDREGAAMPDVADTDGVKVAAGVIAAAPDGGGLFNYLAAHHGSQETVAKRRGAKVTDSHIDDLGATFRAAAKVLGGAGAVTARGGSTTADALWPAGVTARPPPTAGRECGRRRRAGRRSRRRTRTRSTDRRR
jgi:Signal transduction histidine kinase